MIRVFNGVRLSPTLGEPRLHRALGGLSGLQRPRHRNSDKRFDAFAFRGKPYTGEGLDEGATNDVYENDPEANHGARRFKMAGYFNGLLELSVQP